MCKSLVVTMANLRVTLFEPLAFKASIRLEKQVRVAHARDGEIIMWIKKSLLGLALMLGAAGHANAATANCGSGGGILGVGVQFDYLTETCTVGAGFVSTPNNLIFVGISFPDPDRYTATNADTFTVDGVSIPSFILEQNINKSVFDVILTYTRVSVLYTMLLSVSANGGSSISVLSGAVSWEPQISPVPVPAALPLLASGLGALGFIGWRRKNRKTATVAA